MRWIDGCSDGLRHMLPEWPYLVGFIPIVVMMVVKNHRARVGTGLVSLVFLLWFWGGFSKNKSVENDMIKRTVVTLSEQIQQGNVLAVSNALVMSTTGFAIKPFNGFEWRATVITSLEQSKK